MKHAPILLSAALGLAFAGIAQAAQYVYVTGSTAGRSAFYTTIIDGSTVFDSAPTKVTQGSSNPGGASYMTFHGTIGGVDTYVKCHWSGSEAGIADIAGSGTQQFLNDSAVDSLSSATPGPFVTSTVDLAGADNDKVYSRNPKAAITGTKCVVIPFKWVKQKGSAANLTNVTDQGLRQALTGGVPLALFTGNSADTTYVYVSGRDNQSGTRVNAFGTSAFGIFSAPFQIQVNANGSMKDQGAGTYVGDYGYSGGGSLATQMGYDLSQAAAVDVANGTGVEKYSVIAYLGLSDSNTAIANGGTELTYNGVPYSLTAIKEGQYNFWGNYYIYRKSTVSSQALAVYNKLVAPAGLPGHANGTSEIKLTDMHALRNGPTADPVHN